jgi:hypothetical protein
MADQPAISWTDASVQARNPRLDVMRQMMATIAQRHTVAHVETQLGVRRPMLFVVGDQVSAFIVAAVHAMEAVARHYVVAPTLCLLARALPLPLHSLTVNIPRRSWPASGGDAQRRTDLCPDLQRSRHTGVRSRPLASGGGLFGARLRRVGIACKAGWTPLRADAHLDTLATVALRGQAVTPGAVHIEAGARVPFLATGAALQPGGYPGLKFRQCQAGISCRGLCCAERGLCHDRDITADRLLDGVEHNAFPTPK